MKRKQPESRGHHGRIKGLNKYEHRPNGTTVIFIERRDGTVLEAIVDTANFSLISSYRWWAMQAKCKDVKFYAVSAELSSKGKRGSSILMHNLILPKRYGRIDHIDRNGLNNQLSNLRTATKGQQCLNRDKARNKTSTFKGVYRERGKRWRASIRINGVLHDLGHFATEVDAAYAYDAGIRRYRPARDWQYCIFNFPNEVELKKAA